VEPAGRRLTQFSSSVVHLDEVSTANIARITTSLVEFDRMLGGGIMPGSVVLLGGAPGIGKSTLMLQVAGNLANGGNMSVLYVSGEESLEQVKNRADRLKILSKGLRLYLLSETNLENILDAVDKIKPQVLVIDSVQTTYRSDISSAPGSVGQVRECASEFLNLAKGKNITVFLLGHITKEGDIAGPRVLEHIVDTVLYFESEQHHVYRILRSYKNRFGPTSEIGVFEMKQDGLHEVKNPSAFFLSERTKNVPGSAIVTTMEGTRPILLEIQTLVAKTNYGMARRMATGLDYNRVVVLISVLENRIGMALETCDVFVNVAGGIRVKEPAVDLGVCMSIASAFGKFVCPQDTVFIGEVGLAGEIRGISYVQERINESEKLGFEKIVLPRTNIRNISNSKIKLIGIEKLSEAIDGVKV